MNKLVLRFLRDNSGATAIEYALIAGGISIGIITAVWTNGYTHR
jgi:pilus assembly protein Flp/PilA